jgi:chorismate mutase/prephenate dehydratase
LEPFAKSDVSMSRIESRPSRNGMWDYVFFIDIEGHQDDAAIQQVLTELNRNTSIMKVLGSYPRAVL